MEYRLALLIAAMVDYDKGDARRIHHFLKVHEYAAVIGCLEHVDADMQFILETAAIVHDIGIHLSEQKYGSSSGTYQEQEGPAEARFILTQIGGYSETEIARVCYLVGHHHTYTSIDGLDYQILVEADFLVNIFEDELTLVAIENIRRNIFKTSAGLRLLDLIYRNETLIPHVKIENEN